MTLDDLKKLLEMGWPAIVTLACLALWVENRRLTGVALGYAANCGNRGVFPFIVPPQTETLSRGAGGVPSVLGGSALDSAPPTEDEKRLM